MDTREPRRSRRRTRPELFTTRARTRELERDLLSRFRARGDVAPGEPLEELEIASRKLREIRPEVASAALLLREVDEVAKETGKTVPQIALNWLLRRPTVSALIVGARNEEQLKQNLGAIGWELTREQIAKLDAASTVPLAYPYWHQRSTFIDRNPPAV